VGSSLGSKLTRRLIAKRSQLGQLGEYLWQTRFRSPHLSVSVGPEHRVATYRVKSIVVRADAEFRACIRQGRLGCPGVRGWVIRLNGVRSPGYRPRLAAAAGVPVALSFTITMPGIPE
jgi:hypothetical protein